MGLNMWNKIIILMVASALNVAHASEGKFTFLQQDEPSPFVGTLFDPQATARLLANNKFLKEEYDLRLGFELAKQEKSFNLQLEQLQISLDTEKQKCETIISIKDQEIQNLKDLLSKKPTAAAWHGYLGGFLVGSVVTLVVTSAVKK